MHYHGICFINCSASYSIFINNILAVIFFLASLMIDANDSLICNWTISIEATWTFIEIAIVNYKILNEIKERIKATIRLISQFSCSQCDCMNVALTLSSWSLWASLLSSSRILSPSDTSALVPILILSLLWGVIDVREGVFGHS